MARKFCCRKSRASGRAFPWLRILFLSVALWALAGPATPLPGYFLKTAAAQEPRAQQVRFIPQWQPQAQFAGYYVAYEKGFYREQGLEVEILRGGPECPPSEMLAQGRADFGTMQLSAGIVRRARGLKLVNVCQLAQHSALMLVAKKSSGIIEPEDINGKKVGVWGEDFQGQIDAFFRKYNLEGADRSPGDHPEPLFAGRRGGGFGHVVQRIPLAPQRRPEPGGIDRLFPGRLRLQFSRRRHLLPGADL